MYYILSFIGGAIAVKVIMEMVREEAEEAAFRAMWNRLKVPEERDF